MNKAIEMFKQNKTCAVLPYDTILEIMENIAKEPSPKKRMEMVEERRDEAKQVLRRQGKSL
tara:strand:+ start:1174 stop:1356 length:183 start_codon:yes stop_codon:yes gene_type:complete